MTGYEQVKKLEDGIYYTLSKDDLFYFKGKYNKRGNAVFEKMSGKEFPFPSDSLKLFKKLTDEEIKEKISWLEKGLKK